MRLEHRVSFHLNSMTNGLLNAQRKVAQMDSCGVQQREIIAKTRSLGFVQQEVCVRISLVQPHAGQLHTNL